MQNLILLTPKCDMLFIYFCNRCMLVTSKETISISFCKSIYNHTCICSIINDNLFRYYLIQICCSSFIYYTQKLCSLHYYLPPSTCSHNHGSTDWMRHSQYHSDMDCLYEKAPHSVLCMSPLWSEIIAVQSHQNDSTDCCKEYRLHQCLWLSHQMLHQILKKQPQMTVHMKPYL